MQTRHNSEKSIDMERNSEKCFNFKFKQQIKVETNKRIVLGVLYAYLTFNFVLI